MAQERKFARGLTRPGVAAQVRETVSQTIRDSACLVSTVKSVPPRPKTELRGPFVRTIFALRIR